MSNTTYIAAKSGNAAAINTLMTMTRGYAMSVVSAFLGNKYSARIDAEDVCQIVLLEVATDLAGCKAIDWSGYLGWVRLVARNTVYNEVEKMKAMVRSAEKTTEISDEFELVSRSATPAEIADSREQIERALAMAAGISDLTKNVVTLLADGNSGEEIAEKLGTTLAGVYGVVKRFRVAAREACLV